jgi:hypothetical protein
MPRTNTKAYMKIFETIHKTESSNEIPKHLFSIFARLAKLKGKSYIENKFITKRILQANKHQEIGKKLLEDENFLLFLVNHFEKEIESFKKIFNLNEKITNEYLTRFGLEKAIKLRKIIEKLETMTIKAKTGRRKLTIIEIAKKLKISKYIVDPLVNRTKEEKKQIAQAALSDARSRSIVNEKTIKIITQTIIDLMGKNFEKDVPVEWGMDRLREHLKDEIRKKNPNLDITDNKIFEIINKIIPKNIKLKIINKKMSHSVITKGRKNYSKDQRLALELMARKHAGEEISFEKILKVINTKGDGTMALPDIRALWKKANQNPQKYF